MSEQIERITKHFETFERGMNGTASSHIHTMRRHALRRFSQRGFPTLKDEEWRSTNLNPLIRTPFIPAVADTQLQVHLADRFPFAYDGSARVVLVDGRFSSGLSHLPALPDGIVVTNLGKLFTSDPDDVLPRVGSIAADALTPFAHLNLAFLHDGAAIVIPRNVRFEQPLYVFHLSTVDPEPTVSHSRSIILAGENSETRIVEVFAGDDGVYWKNTVTEIIADRAAVVHHYRLQEESTNGYLTSSTLLSQARNSSVTTTELSLGGALVRNDLHAVLNDEGAETTLNGLVILNGGQHVDNHSTIDHASPHCSSHEVYKAILDGSSRNVFSGKIIVRKDAQKTDARQTNNNLILSDTAMVDTKPQLEIFADDVKCTHGATIGRLDEEALFYLRTRGIEKDAAKGILTWAFASEIVGRVRVEALREYLDTALHDRLHVVRDEEE